jgi:Tfp pilus assembly protein PilF
MGRSFYSVKETLAPVGEGSPVRPQIPAAIEVADQALRYTVFEENGRLFQKQFQVDPAGRETNVDTREIVYVLGSGNHSQSFVTRHQGRLYQMPLCWYPEARRWDLCPGYEIRNQYFERKLDDTCLFCHDGHVERSGTFSNQFAEPLTEGINCERCHGPGSLHVARWSTPSEEGKEVYGRDENLDPTIVNPVRLPPDLRLQVCLQCHLGDSAQSERVMRRADHLDGYRPGLPLPEFLGTYRFRETLPGRFGLGAQADRLSLSRCFTRTPGGLQCTTCHDPHVEVYDLRRSDPGQFDAACATCHGANDCAVPSDRRQVGCIACHMRRAEPHDQRYTTFMDHWIRRRPSEGAGRVRADLHMEAFLPGGGENGPPAGRSFDLGRAHYYKKLNSPDAAPMSWDYAIEPLQEAAASDPRDPRPLLFLGKVEMSRGQPARAVPYLRRAAELDPNYVEAAQELGSALLAIGSLDEASRELKRALDLGPSGDDLGAVLNELARIEMQEGHLPEARARLEAALAVEPLAVEITTNLGVLASLERDDRTALTWFRRSLALAPNLPALHVYLAEILAREGALRNVEEALREARRAMELTPPGSPMRRKITEICRSAGRSDCAPGHPDRGL